MKAAVLRAAGPPEALSYAELPDPMPGDGELLMRVQAISIEGGDTLNRGRVAVPPGTLHVVGYQAAGVVVGLGPGARGFEVGEPVTAFGFAGSHAELRVVKPEHAFRVPAGMEMATAAVVPISFGTAHACLFEACRLVAGETVLIPAAGSGLGVAAIQLAKRAGARVIAMASSPAKLARLRALGADEVVDASLGDTAEAVKALTGGRGVDVVMDGVGGAVLEASIRSLAYRGRVAMVGAAGREAMRVDVGPMLRGAQQLTGVFLGAEFGTPRVRASIEQCLADVAAGRLAAVIDRVYPLREAAAAHAYIESRQAVGRVVLTTDHHPPR